MAEVVSGSVGSGSDVNTAENPTQIAMAYLQDEVTFHLQFDSSCCENASLILKVFFLLAFQKGTHLTCHLSTNVLKLFVNFRF